MEVHLIPAVSTSNVLCRECRAEQERGCATPAQSPLNSTILTHAAQACAFTGLIDAQQSNEQCSAKLSARVDVAIAAEVVRIQPATLLATNACKHAFPLPQPHRGSSLWA